MRFSSLFHDHAVLQRDFSLPVWGVSGAGETVVVTLAGREARVDAGADGRWLVRFPALPAGGPFELAAESPSGRAVARDVLIGEVWLCSGQSNMEWKLSQSDPYDPAVFGAMPDVRLLTVRNPAALGRQEEIVGRWEVATPATWAAFSGVGGWFGQKIRAELGVPVGLICTAWGGTRIQAWMSREALVRDPLGREEMHRFESEVFLPPSPDRVVFADFADWEKRGVPQDTGNRGLAEGWAASAFDDGAWPTMKLPGRWQERGHPGNGILWFRRTVAVPPVWNGRDLELRLGAIDKHDDTWVNGERVGGLSWEDGASTWSTPRVYPVPARLVGADGRLTVAVRARSHVYHGGFIGPAAEMGIAPVGGEVAGAERISLAGPWRYAVEQDWGVVVPPEAAWGPTTPNSPGILFGSRVASLLPFALRGVLWYQGESNAHDAVSYRRLLPALIRDWRRAWGQGDFPFLQVQLANFKPAEAEPVESEWAALREAQALALTEPHVGLAVAIDVGESNDIHPKDKRTVGLRLAQWALAETYGRGGLPSGPLYAGHAVEAERRIRIRFRHAEGLRTGDGGAPRHVAIAGSDRVFVWAEAAIEGETLVVRHPQIPDPRAVRYAWADNPESCNLVNAAALPAAPFRTDAP